ncbi:hypothetical protein ACFX2I_008211 [Malus domestica]
MSIECSESLSSSYFFDPVAETRRIAASSRNCFTLMPRNFSVAFIFSDPVESPPPTSSLDFLPLFLLTSEASAAEPSLASVGSFFS